MTSTPFVLPVPTGRSVAGVIDLPAGRPGPRPTVVVAHGFKGFLRWGFFPPLAELLTSRGFAVVRFNFSGAGQGPDDEAVTDLVAFETNTFTREQEDLAAVLGGLPGLVPGRLDLERVGFFGHSRGGGAAILAAGSTSPAPIRSLVTWAAISTYDRWSGEEKAAWRAAGGLPVVNARTGQRLTLGTGVLDDLETNAATLDIRAAAGRVTCPWLLVHGTADETVPFAEAEALAAAGRPELLAIERAGHTFGATHPFRGPTPELIRAMNATQAWFKRWL